METDRQNKQTAKSEKVTNTKASNKSNSFTAQLVAITLAIIAISCSIYAIYLHFQSQVGTLKQLPELQTAFQQLSQKQQDLMAHVENTKNNLDTRINELHSSIETLEKAWRSEQAQSKFKANDWLLLKARHYIELAQVNAYWNDNKQPTIALLKQADTILSNVHESNLFPVRQAIAQEIKTLEALPNVDLPGLLSQLDAAQTLVLKAPIKNSLMSQTSDTQNKENEDSPATWRQRLADNLHIFEKLVIIRHHEENIQPLLTQAQIMLARQRIQLNLEQTQWALLQKNETLYHLTLKQALRDIQSTFSPKASETKALIKTIKSLQNTDISVPSPSFKASLNLLNQFIEQNTINTNTSIKSSQPKHEEVQ